MFPNRSKQDQEQYELVKTMNQLHTIKIDIDEHGVAIYPFALPEYLSYNLHEIEKLAGGGQHVQNECLNKNWRMVKFH